MALVYTIHHPMDILQALAANDEFLSRLFQWAGDSFNSYQCSTTTKELYLSPFAFIPDSLTSGWLVFVPQVPWLNDLHRRVRDEMKYCGRRNVPRVLEHLEKAMHKVIGWDEMHLYPFTKDGCYPNVADVEEGDLYEMAMKVTCAVMDWKVPPDWRGMLKELLERRGIETVPTIADFNNFNPAPLPLSLKDAETDPLAADEYAASTPVQKLKLSFKNIWDDTIADEYVLSTPVQNKRHCGSPIGSPMVMSDNR